MEFVPRTGRISRGRECSRDLHRPRPRVSQLHPPSFTQAAVSAHPTGSAPPSIYQFCTPIPDTRLLVAIDQLWCQGIKWKKGSWCQDKTPHAYKWSCRWDFGFWEELGEGHLCHSTSECSRLSTRGPKKTPQIVPAAHDRQLANRSCTNQSMNSWAKGLLESGETGNVTRLREYSLKTEKHNE